MTTPRVCMNRSMREGFRRVDMKANQFIVFGNPRTFWDFYMGHGLGVSIALTMESIVLWFLAPPIAHHGAKLRPALAAFAIGYLILAVNSFRYFFMAPVVVELFISVSLFAAIATTRREADVPAVRE